MSSRNSAVVVSRTYNATPDACIQAVKLLLDCHAKKEAAPESRPEDEKGVSKNDSLARHQYTRT